jgi:hypothetical protein
MDVKLSLAAIISVCVMLVLNGCVYVGSTTGTDHAVVEGGKAIVTVSPSVKFEVPVNISLGDEVAKAAANAAVGYLKGVPGAITQLNRDIAIQKGVESGVRQAQKSDQQVTNVDQEQLKAFVQQVVEKL